MNKLFVTTFILLSSSLVFAEDAKSVSKSVNQKLDNFEAWSKESFDRLTVELNADFDRIEKKLKGMKSDTGGSANKGLDKVEAKLKEIGKRINDLGKEKKPKKAEAEKIKTDLKKAEADLK